MDSKRLWIDTDPSGLFYTGLDCDDDLAILIALALHERHIIQLDGVSICGGNAPLRHTWNDVQQLWEYVDGVERTGIIPIKGYGWRSMQPAMKLLHYYNILFPDVQDSDDASSSIVERVKNGNQTPLTILSLGPPTNIAKAIENLTSSSMDNSNIAHIYLMGGELTNRQLDLNFRTDRGSSRLVLEANVPKTIIPIQTCGQVSVTNSWLESLGCGNEPQDAARLAVCAYMTKLKHQQFFMPRFVNRAVRERMQVDSRLYNHNWKASPNLESGFIPWDIVALLTITHPNEFSEWKYHRVSISHCTGKEPCDGTMEVREAVDGDSFDNWSGIVRIPHTVRNETKLLEIMLDLILDIKVPTTREQPRMMWWGFVPDFGLCIVTIIFLYCCAKLGLMRGRV